VFFVISGYLISNIIFQSLEAGNFRYVDFYQRRIRRIFPALGVVLTCSLVFGWSWLLPDEYAQLGLHVGASAFFLQNFALWYEAGYFDSSASLKPLLHLWSLGIEEQFYILYPICIASLWHRRRVMIAFMIGTFFLSLIWSVLLVAEDRAAAFYLPHARLWELMLGGLLSVARYLKPQSEELKESRDRETPCLGAESQSLLRNGASTLGVALIVSSCFLFDRATLFPGLMALIPVSGSALILYYGQGSLINSRILSLTPIVWIGLISYPLYLCHWSLIAFTRLLSAEEPTVQFKLKLFVASVLLAYLVYKYIELPLRFGQASRSLFGRFRTALIALGVFSVGAAGFSVKYHGGFPDRPILEDAERQILQRHLVENDIIKKYPLEGCSYEQSIREPAIFNCFSYGNPRARETIIVWGDSHAESWSRVFYEIGHTLQARVIVFSHKGCAPILNTRRTDGVLFGKDCANFELPNSILNAIQSLQPKHIFLVARWSIYVHGLPEDRVLEQGTPFLIDTLEGTATAETSKKALEKQLPETIKALSIISPLTIIRTVPTLKTSVDVGFIRARDRFEPTLQSHRRFEEVPDLLIDRATKDANSAGGKVTVLDPAELLCNPEKCHAMLNFNVVYSDDSHLTAQGSLMFREMIMNHLK
jgi:peptidoglycan/LPS O-acetylase OafA/YrhL